MTIQLHPFEFPMQVRDYECDMQRVVNNLHYLNYLDHARHKFLASINVDLAQWRQHSLSIVVTNIDLEYLSSLVSGDDFVVTVAMHRPSHLQLTFDQEVLRLPDRKPMLQAKIGVTFVNANEDPFMPDALSDLLGPITH